MKYMPPCGHPNATSTLTTEGNGRLVYNYYCPDCKYRWKVTV